METIINISDNQCAIYKNEEKTIYEDIILSWDMNNYEHECRVCILKLPNKILYNNTYKYQSESENKYFHTSRPILKVLCEKYLFIYIYVDGFNKYIHVIDIYTGKILIEKKHIYDFDIFETNYNDHNYIFLNYDQTHITNRFHLTDIYDDTLQHIITHNANGIIINKDSNYRLYPKLLGRHYSNPISNNYIMLQSNIYNIQVFDFVNNKIIFDKNDKCEIHFIKWRNTQLIYNISNTTVIQQIVDRDECIVCFESIQDKYLINPCGHTQTCGECLHNEIYTKIDKCPMCRIDIISIIKIH